MGFESMMSVARQQPQFPGNKPEEDSTIIRASKLLDLSFYLMNGDDVRQSNMNAVEHFCRYGWREGRKPNIYFDPVWYLATNPDVARLGMNPLRHYITDGERHGRRPVVYFDPCWYRATYGLEPYNSPLAHFLAHRRSQRFSPHPQFDVAWYMEKYGNLIGPNRDPFAHYLQTGTQEDIDPSPHFSASAYRRLHLGRPSRAFRHLMRPETHHPFIHYLSRSYA